MSDSIKTNSFEGDMSIGRNAAIGGDMTVQGAAMFKGNMIVAGWLDAENIKTVNKGLFATVNELKANYPEPRNGWWAVIVDGSTVYRVSNGEWIEDTTGLVAFDFITIAQETGLSESIVMSQAAVTRLLSEIVLGDGDIVLVQSTGSSILSVMSQAAVTQELNAVNGNVSELLAEAFPLLVNFSGASIYEVGTTPSINLVWSVSRKGSVVTPTSQTLDGESTTSPKTVTPKATTSYELSVTYDGITKTASQTAQFVYASYYGVLASGATFANNVSSLTKVIKDTKTLTTSYTLSNQCVVYAYPASFGDLSSIKDANGFEYIDSYTKTTAQYDEQTYNVYTMTNPTTISGLTQIFI